MLGAPLCPSVFLFGVDTVKVKPADRHTSIQILKTAEAWAHGRLFTACSGDYHFFDHDCTIDNWSHVLSLGEQQKVAFARAILQRPQWLFLDVWRWRR